MFSFEASGAELHSFPLERFFYKEQFSFAVHSLHVWVDTPVYIAMYLISGSID